MNGLGHVLFNLLFNALTSFAFALGIAYATLRLSRLAPSRAQLWLLLLPLIKPLWDVATGVPPSSFLWAKLAGHTQDLGSFRLGIGVHPAGPLFDFELGAFSNGLLYPQSLADLFDTAISKRLGAFAPAAIAFTVLLIGCVRLAWHASSGLRAGLYARRHSRCVQQRSCGLRRVAVRVSETYTGVPYAGGLLRPYVLFSARVYAALTPQEREAALQHELAHIAHHDVSLLACLQLLSDLLWYLPGLTGLRRRIAHNLELRADAAALCAGAQPQALATALVSTAEILQRPVFAAAMWSHPGLLSLRVRRLLEPEIDPAPRRGDRLRFGLKLLLIAIVTSTVIRSSFLGNYTAALVRFAHT